jgi:hypothetical protein
MLHVNHFGTNARQKPYNAEDSGLSFNLDKMDRFFGAIRGRAAAPLLERIPGVRFANGIDVVTRDAGAATAWSRRSPACTKKALRIKGLILVRTKTNTSAG